jgi:hypothetical protein
LEFSSYTSQITGGAENAIPLHVDIPHTGGRGSGLLFEVFLQKYSQFLYEYFPLVPFYSRVTLVIFVLQTVPKEKITRIKVG